jgi:alpha-tubulin suppressor-like RCC1 family protein
LNTSKHSENEIQVLEFGDSTSYFVTLNGRVYTWGSNDCGQLGTGENLEDNCLEPRIIPDLEKIKVLSSGDSHVAALDKNNTLWVWGDNSNGQLGAPFIDARKAWINYFHKNNQADHNDNNEELKGNFNNKFI